jgi:hypothetical protein
MLKLQFPLLSLNMAIMEYKDKGIVKGIQFQVWFEIRAPIKKMSIGLAYQGKDIVFRFIIEYSSLRDFGP